MSWVDHVEQVVAAGDHETALVMLFRDLLEFTEEQIEELRAGPEWAGRVAKAPTIVREARAEQGWEYPNGGMDRIAAPTLLLSGSDSTPDIKQATDAALAAIESARVRVLDGHAHIAHRTHPAMVEIPERLALVTTHPSALLRLCGRPGYAQAFAELVHDLQVADQHA